MSGTCTGTQLLFKAADPLACGAHPATVEAVVHIVPGLGAPKMWFVKGDRLVWCSAAAHLLESLENRLGLGHTA